MVLSLQSFSSNNFNCVVEELITEGIELEYRTSYEITIFFLPFTAAEQVERAFNLGLAAILGKGVYNFGELVSFYFFELHVLKYSVYLTPQYITPNCYYELFALKYIYTEIQVVYSSLSVNAPCARQVEEHGETVVSRLTVCFQRRKHS